jgi:hypothetical protein
MSPVPTVPLVLSLLRMRENRHAAFVIDWVFFIFDILVRKMSILTMGNAE